MPEVFILGLNLKQTTYCVLLLFFSLLTSKQCLRNTNEEALSGGDCSFDLEEQTCGSLSDENVLIENKSNGNKKIKKGSKVTLECKDGTYFWWSSTDYKRSVKLECLSNGSFRDVARNNSVKYLRGCSKEPCCIDTFENLEPLKKINSSENVEILDKENNKQIIKGQNNSFIKFKCSNEEKFIYFGSERTQIYTLKCSENGIWNRSSKLPLCAVPQCSHAFSEDSSNVKIEADANYSISSSWDTQHDYNWRYLSTDIGKAIVLNITCLREKEFIEYIVYPRDNSIYQEQNHVTTTLSHFSGSCREVLNTNKFQIQGTNSASNELQPYDMYAIHYNCKPLPTIATTNPTRAITTAVGISISKTTREVTSTTFNDSTISSTDSLTTKLEFSSGKTTQDPDDSAILLNSTGNSTESTIPMTYSTHYTNPNKVFRNTTENITSSTLNETNSTTFPDNTTLTTEVISMYTKPTTKNTNTLTSISEVSPFMETTQTSTKDSSISISKTSSVTQTTTEILINSSTELPTKTTEQTFDTTINQISSTITQVPFTTKSYHLQSFTSHSPKFTSITTSTSSSTSASTPTSTSLSTPTSTSVPTIKVEKNPTSQILNSTQTTPTVLLTLTTGHSTFDNTKISRHSTVYSTTAASTTRDVEKNHVNDSSDERST